VSHASVYQATTARAAPRQALQSRPACVIWAAGTDQISFTLNFSKGASQIRPTAPQSAACSRSKPCVDATLCPPTRSHAHAVVHPGQPAARHIRAPHTAALRAADLAAAARGSTSSASTTSSCAWASRATGASSTAARPSRSTSRRRSRRPGRSRSCRRAGRPCPVPRAPAWRLRCGCVRGSDRGEVRSGRPRAMRASFEQAYSYSLVCFSNTILRGSGARARAQVRAPAPGVPLVAFTLKSEKRTHGYNEFDVADRLRQFGAPAMPICRY
jgi:hypothetical protein